MDLNQPQASHSILAHHNSKKMFQEHNVVCYMPMKLVNQDNAF
jgi:hypothetical protein